MNIPCIAMTKCLALDPGPAETGWVIYDAINHKLIDKGITANTDMLGVVERFRSVFGPVICEMIASYGMPVGRDVFETCVWIGRFMETVESYGGMFKRLTRIEVKKHLCHNGSAKDSNINQAIRDRFCEWHGCLEKQVKGTKANPGPLYGIKSHMWAALGVALTWAEQSPPQDGLMAVNA